MLKTDIKPVESNTLSLSNSLPLAETWNSSVVNNELIKNSEITLTPKLLSENTPDVLKGFQNPLKPSFLNTGNVDSSSFLKIKLSDNFV